MRKQIGAAGEGAVDVNTLPGNRFGDFGSGKVLGNVAGLKPRDDDLIDAGYSPGPRFKEILAAIEDGQLEGRLRDRDAAMEFVGQQFPTA